MLAQVARPTSGPRKLNDVQVIQAYESNCCPGGSAVSGADDEGAILMMDLAEFDTPDRSPA